MVKSGHFYKIVENKRSRAHSTLNWMLNPMAPLEFRISATKFRSFLTTEMVKNSHFQHFAKYNRYSAHFTSRDTVWQINVENDRLGINAEFGSRVAIPWCLILCFVWNIFTTTAKCIYVLKWGNWNEKSRKIRFRRLITYKGQFGPFYGQIQFYGRKKEIIICYYNHL